MSDGFSIETKSCYTSSTPLKNTAKVSFLIQLCMIRAFSLNPEVSPRMAFQNFLIGQFCR